MENIESLKQKISLSGRICFVEGQGRSCGESVLESYWRRLFIIYSGLPRDFSGILKASQSHSRGTRTVSVFFDSQMESKSRNIEVIVTKIAIEIYVVQIERYREIIQALI